LDAELVRRGLAATRAAAADAIRAGRVTVGGRPAAKAETLVAAGEPVAVEGPARPYASRGGEKLAAALDRFGIDPAGRNALDLGASSGGFTDVLLRRGAERVVAVDVGYGQLDWSLRQDPRVTVMERTNARTLRRDSLPYRPGLVTADLSFISLRLVLPVIADVSADQVDGVMLVKPQFEAERRDVGPGGVVTDPDAWSAAIRRVASVSRDSGLDPVRVMASPLLGPAGNVEFLLHAARTRAAATDGSECGNGGFDLLIDGAVQDGIALLRARARSSDEAATTSGSPEPLGSKPDA
jgi:23S rRNA (cytidine1920-2'-O)/16S rRNA (cytidine1409-2'-O)-methyltransferase